MNKRDDEEIDDEEVKVIDDTEDDIVPYRYSITSYGADYPVDSLIKRLNAEVIFIPSFQRAYVWTVTQASRFIESLLLGLPVPGVFLSKESDTNKLLIIDGQQRLKSLLFFYNGIINGKEFKLLDVQDRFLGKTYKTLTQEDKLTLDDSIIHATVVKQEEPSEDNSSIYHIFERLNTSGTRLQAQEIRACIYHGKFNDLLAELNETSAWRNIYGKKSKRLKDRELILRFFALFFDAEQYERPFKDFLNKFMAKNRDLQTHKGKTLKKLFCDTIECVEEMLGDNAFRPERALNAAVFDAVMVAVAKRLEKGDIKNKKEFVETYKELLQDKDFGAATGTATSDAPVVKSRLEIAIDYIEDVD